MDTTALLLLATRSAQPPVWCVTDTGTNTNANNGTQPVTKTWTIPAYDALAGTIYEIEVPYSGVFGSETIGFKPYLNAGAVGTSGGDTIGAAFFSGAAGFAGLVKLKVQVTAAGASGAVNLFIDGGIGNNSGRASGINSTATYLSSQATGTAFNTTVSNTLAVAVVFGSSAGTGQTVSGTGSKFTRFGR